MSVIDPSASTGSKPRPGGRPFGHRRSARAVVSSSVRRRQDPAETRAQRPNGGAAKRAETAGSLRVLDLQRAAGNRAVAAMVHSVQRCGDVPASSCPCHAVDGEAPTVARAEQSSAPAADPLSGRLLRLATELRALRSYAGSRAAGDGMSAYLSADLSALDALADQVQATATGSDQAAKQAVSGAFGPAFVARAEAEARQRAGTLGDDVVALIPDATAQSVGAAPVQRQVAETLVMVGGGMVATAEAGAPVEVGTGPPGWLAGAFLLVAGAALAGIGIYMASSGNVADTGIMEEARALVAAGKAPDICAALAMLMAATKDSRRKLRIKATQKAQGCRHSRHS